MAKATKGDLESAHDKLKAEQKKKMDGLIKKAKEAIKKAEKEGAVIIQKAKEEAYRRQQEAEGYHKFLLEINANTDRVLSENDKAMKNKKKTDSSRELMATNGKIGEIARHAKSK